MSIWKGLAEQPKLWEELGKPEPKPPKPVKPKPTRKADNPMQERINELADQHGTMEAAARALGLNPGYLRHIYYGRRNPRPGTLAKLGMKAIITIEYRRV